MNAKPDEQEDSVWQFNNVYLGSRSKKESRTTVSGFISDADGDRAFQSFKYRLSRCVNGIRERELPGTSILVQDTDQVGNPSYRTEQRTQGFIDRFISLRSLTAIT